MEFQDLLQLIKSDPHKLSYFFEEAHETIERDPKFGLIIDIENKRL